MSLLDALEVPAARSRASTSPTDSPRVAASSAAPAPVMPPPMTRRSSSPERARVERPAPGPRVERAAHERGDVAHPLVEQRPQRRVELAVPAVQVVVDVAQLRVGLHRLAARRRPSPRAASATDECSPAPAAASIAAPRAVVSTSSGTTTGSPVMCARSSHSSRPFAPPPTHTTSRGRVAGGADRLDHVAQRQRVALQQRPREVRARRARRSCRTSRARARAFHSGAIAPASAGTHETPPAPGGRALGERRSSSS